VDALRISTLRPGDIDGTSVIFISIGGRAQCPAATTLPNPDVFAAAESIVF
jgi:hypothetical protein